MESLKRVKALHAELSDLRRRTVTLPDVSSGFVDVVNTMDASRIADLLEASLREVRYSHVEVETIVGNESSKKLDEKRQRAIELEQLIKDWRQLADMQRLLRKFFSNPEPPPVVGVS